MCNRTPPELQQQLATRFERTYISPRRRNPLLAARSGSVIANVYEHIYACRCVLVSYGVCSFIVVRIWAIRCSDCMRRQSSVKLHRVLSVSNYFRCYDAVMQSVLSLHTNQSVRSGSTKSTLSAKCFISFWLLLSRNHRSHHYVSSFICWLMSHRPPILIKAIRPEATIQICSALRHQS